MAIGCAAQQEFLTEVLVSVSSSVSARSEKVLCSHISEQYRGPLRKTSSTITFVSSTVGSMSPV